MKLNKIRPYRPYAITWAVLVVLLAIEVLATRVVGWGNTAPLFGIAMAAVVAYVFMDLRRSDNLVRIFAMAGVFWLIILLGLGITDPATRVQVPVPQATLNWRFSPTGPGEH